MAVPQIRFMTYIKFLTAVTFLLLLLIFSPLLYAVTKTDYPFLGGDTSRTGQVLGNGPGTSKVFWIYTHQEWNKKFPQDSGYQGAQATYSVVKNGVVYSTIGHFILALDLKTKQEKWLFDAKDKIDLSARGYSLAAGDRFLIFTIKGEIIALDLETGNLAWRYKTETSFSHSIPLIVNSTVFVGDDAGFIHAIDEKSGKEIWKKDLQAKEIHSSPTFGEGLIFIGTEGNLDSKTANEIESFMYALKFESGGMIWRFPIKKVSARGSGYQDLIHATAAYKDGKIYFGIENGRYYSLDAKTGQLIWEKSGFGWFTTASSLDEENIYTGNWDGNIYAFKQADGVLIWKYQAEKDGPFEITRQPGGGTKKQGINSWPIVTNNKVFIGAPNGYFYALNKKDGSVIWKEKYGMAWPVMAEDILLIPNHPPQDALKGEMIIAISEKSPATISNLLPLQVQLNFGNKLMWETAGIFLLIVGIGGMIIFWGRRILTKNFKKT